MERKRKRRRRSPTPMKRYVGQVVCELVSPGSKSERMAVQLDTGDARYILRRAGANPFRDPDLDALVGETIVCTGLKRGPYLYLKQWNRSDTES